MKVLNIKELNLINNRFPWLFEIRHNKYGKIVVKQSFAKGKGYTEAYRFMTENHKRNKKWGYRIDCETYFLLCFDADWKNIEQIYIIPNVWLNGVENVTIYKNTEYSKYDEFKIGFIPYNDALHNLDTYIGKIMVDIEDVKKWLKND